MKKSIHTVHNSEKSRWENKVQGNSKPLSFHHTKENALDRAEKIAGKTNAEHFIHGKNGKIQERKSYGNDPFPPRG